MPNERDCSSVGLSGTTCVSRLKFLAHSSEAPGFKSRSSGASLFNPSVAPVSAALASAGRVKARTGSVRQAGCQVGGSAPERYPGAQVPRGRPLENRGESPKVLTTLTTAAIGPWGCHSGAGLLPSLEWRPLVSKRRR